MTAIQSRGVTAIHVHRSHLRTARGQRRGQQASTAGRADQGNALAAHLLQGRQRQHALAVSALGDDYGADTGAAQCRCGSTSQRHGSAIRRQRLQTRGKANRCGTGENHHVRRQSAAQCGTGEFAIQRRPHAEARQSQRLGAARTSRAQQAGIAADGTRYDDTYAGVHAGYATRLTKPRFLMTCELEHLILDTIPLARAMQLRVGNYDGDTLQMHAPLAPNINDKGCAFGGSLDSLMTLAGWGLVTLALRAQAMTADVFVANSEISYLAPLTDELHAHAQLADDADWQRFFSTFETRGKARIMVASAIRGTNGDACVQRARFVAKRTRIE